MEEQIKKRRAEHYNKNTGNVVKEEKKDNFKIIVQLLICMVLIFCFMNEDVKKTHAGKVITDYTKNVIHKHTDFKIPVDKIRNTVEKVVGTPNLPVSENIFNENSVMSND